MKRALVWASVVGAVVLSVYIAKSLPVIFGAIAFASIVDGGARLLGRIPPIPRRSRVVIVLVLTVAFFTWLACYAGSTISRDAAMFKGAVPMRSATGR